MQCPEQMIKIHLSMQISGGADANPMLQYLQLPIVDTRSCADSYARFSANSRTPIIITENQICAQGTANRDACQGLYRLIALFIRSMWSHALDSFEYRRFWRPFDDGASTNRSICSAWVGFVWTSVGILLDLHFAKLICSCI